VPGLGQRDDQPVLQAGHLEHGRGLVQADVGGQPVVAAPPDQPVAAVAPVVLTQLE
jgi:hypothetical protein